jgi:hypothetical protein
MTSSLVQTLVSALQCIISGAVLVLSLYEILRIIWQKGVLLRPPQRNFSELEKIVLLESDAIPNLFIIDDLTQVHRSSQAVCLVQLKLNQCA